jgi:PAS domain S-box-containing protein/putative nucleotidyltransferase with HDIG domain
MNDPSKTNQELIEEISALKQRIRELEQAESERKQVEEALWKSEEKFRTIFDRASDGILIADAVTNKFLQGNTAICSMLGYTKEEIESLTIHDIHPPKDISHVLDEFEKLAKGEKVLAEDLPVLRKDGSIFYADIGASPAIIGEVHCLLGIFRDITDRKRAKEALRKSESLLNCIIQSTADGILVVDGKGKVLLANYRFAELWRIPKDVVAKGDDNELLRFVVDQLNDPEAFLAKVRELDISDISDFDTLLFKDGRIFERFSIPLIFDGRIEGRVWSFRDITDRKRTEEALTKNEEKFRKAFYTSPDSVNINRFEDGMYVSINPGFTKITGYTEEDIIGKTSIDYNIWENIEDRQRLVAGLRKDGEVINLETAFRIKGGDIRYGLMSASVIDLNGVPHVLSITRDITDRKRAEEELKRLSQQNELILFSAAEGILGLDIQGKHTFINPAAARMLGYEVEELLGCPSHSTWHHTKSNGSPYPQEECEIYAAYREGVAHRTSTEVFWRKDGTSFPVEYASTPIYEQDRLAGAVLTFTDITERKRAEEELLRSRQWLSLHVEQAPLAVVEFNLEGRVRGWNPAAGKIFGYPHEEAIGQHWTFMVPESVWGSLEGVWEGLIAKRGGNRSTNKNITKGGRIIDCEWFNTPLVDQQGETIGVASLVMDITDRKQAEKQLQETLESLRKAINTTIQVMVSAVETRDPYTAGHQIRSADLARAIATEMGLPQEKIDAIRMAGSIHDIGKLSIPAEILSKPTKLSELEFSMIKEHARKGFEMLKDVESPWPLADIVHQHHERMDGTGYPRNLKGEEILIEARILTVADVVEAMASHRPYRAGLGINAALNEIEKNRGIFYDRVVADACLRLFREKGFKLEGA